MEGIDIDIEHFLLSYPPQLLSFFFCFASPDLHTSVDILRLLVSLAIPITIRVVS